MAGMTGIEVLERLKFVDPTIEVVMMTAFETNDSLRQALRLQACDYSPTIRHRNHARRRCRRDGTPLPGQRGPRTPNKLQQLQSEIQQQKLEEQIVRTRVKSTPASSMISTARSPSSPASSRSSTSRSATKPKCRGRP